MANVIKLKRSNSAGATPSLVFGELGLNTADSIMYYGDNANTATDFTNLMSDATTDTAGTVVKGVASYDADFFTISSGNVGIKNSAITGAQILNGTIDTLELANDAVSNAKLSSIVGSEAVTADVIRDNAVTLGDKTTGNYVATITAGEGIDVSGSGSETAAVTISAEDASYTNKGVLQVSSNQFTIVSGILNGLAAGSVSNSELAHSSVTIGSDTLALGGTLTALNGLTDINLTSGNKTIFDGVGANTLTIGANTTTLKVAGNLVVDGTTTTVNSTTVTIDDVVLTLGGDTAPASDPAVDYGIEFRYWDETDSAPLGEAVLGFIGYDDSTEEFTMLTEASVAGGAYSGTLGDLNIGAVKISSLNGSNGSGGNATLSNVTLDGGTYS